MQRNTVLIEQTYPGYEDHVNHFMTLLPAFRDKRYMKIDGKLIFVIYSPLDFENVADFIRIWQQLATQHGLPGFYFVGMTPSTLSYKPDDPERRHTLPNTESSAEIYNYILSMGFDAVNSFGKRRGEMLVEGKVKNISKTILRHMGISVGTMKYDYSKTVKGYFAPEDRWENVFPTILPQWDRTPRAGSYDGVYVNATPERFEQHIRHVLDIIKDKRPEHQIIFLKSWNEWGEGNYVEPDTQYGHGWLEAIRNVIRTQP